MLCKEANQGSCEEDYGQVSEAVEHSGVEDPPPEVRDVRGELTHPPVLI